MDLTASSGIYLNTSITASTNVRDVSQMLEVWAHEDTPLLNRVEWGDESGGIIIEWLHEHLGWYYIEISAGCGSASTTIGITSGIGGLSEAEQSKQLGCGALLYAVGAGGDQSGSHCWLAVSTVSTDYEITFAFLSSTTASLAASTKVYIVGNFAPEAAVPRTNTSIRARTLLSNKMAILYKDIQISGSQLATDMHAVGDELQHNIKMRTLELQFERERSMLLSWGVARATSTTPYMRGFADLLLEQSGNAWVDDATTTLTESAFNDLVAEIADNGGNPNVVLGSYTQIRKFTGWESDRVRTKPDEKLGGKYVAQYLSDVGITVDLLPLKKFPVGLLFVLDTNKIRLRAKKGRKLLLQKLGLNGDFVQWQMVSEYSMEHHGVAQGHHGAFTALT